MEKIVRYRPTQTVSLENFINNAIDTGICKYCESYEECYQVMGMENIEAISGNGCSAFDSSIENLKKFYLIEKCKVIGT